MIYPLYSIRDIKGDYFSPRIEQNEPSAIRSFAFTVNTPGTTIHSFPEDYQLFRVGDFDSDTGRLLPLANPEFVVSASAVFEKDGDRK